MMDWKLALVVVPAPDVDRAKRFYGERRSGSFAYAPPTPMLQAPSQQEPEMNK